MECNPLAQPSFLKQVDSRAVGHSKLAKSHPNIHEKESFDPDVPRIEDVIRGIARDVPDEEWEKLPHDLTDRLDYYLYGTEDQ
ncbi:MAG: hypothetical protein OXC39_04175 [Candidatus Dadabacteria bacterium]|nr:hypothetical protein [Candidatus Dadabacteria bacterium]